jgi:lantibiotic biosynthesis protein
LPHCWKPLLAEQDTARAWRVIETIATSLLKASTNPNGPASLASGDAGMALFYGSLAMAGQGEVQDCYADHARDLLMRAIERSGSIPFDATLYGGSTGIAWVIEQFQDRLLEATGDPNEEVDDALDELLEFSPWPGSYDLIGGLVGMGVYTLDRLPRAAAVRRLETIIQRLVELAEIRSDGITWFTPPHLVPSLGLPESQRAGCYNLGMAHGVPGVAAFLASVLDRGVTPARVGELLEGTSNWLLARRGTGRPFSTFTYFVGPQYWMDEEPRPARVAWCYGDPGAATALLWAGIAAGLPSRQEEALEILRACTKHPPERTGVVDPGLCHGAAGLAHIFNRVWQATGEELFAEAARFWFRRAMEMIEAPGPNRPSEPRQPFGFLTGEAGTGLALLSAISDQEPLWDGVLLLSPPHARSRA